MIVEDGVSGGKTIGPRLQQLYTSLFAYERARKEESYERLRPKKWTGVFMLPCSY